MDLKWIITTIIAVWGAGLSTYQFVMKLRERVPRVSVILRVRMEVLDEVTQERFDAFSIDVRNVGDRDVFFRDGSPSLEIGGLDEQFVLGGMSSNVRFPTTLRPNDGFRMFDDRDRLIELVRENLGNAPYAQVRANVHDSGGNVYRSEFVTFQLPRRTMTPV
jgi:hypothetical protein